MYHLLYTEANYLAERFMEFFIFQMFGRKVYGIFYFPDVLFYTISLFFSNVMI